MKIRIDQITDSGLELSETRLSASLDLGRQDISFTEPIHLSAYVTKGINSISVQMKIQGAMQLNCSRCLEEFSLPLERSLNLTLHVKEQKEVDLIDNFREEIMLNYPLKPLCRLDCRGLCPACGKNLNKEKCNCK